MATSKISMPLQKTFSINSASDIAALFSKIGVYEGAFVRFTQSFSNACVGLETNLTGMIYNLESAADATITSYSAGYLYVIRFNTSGAVMAKRRIAMTTF